MRTLKALSDWLVFPLLACIWLMFATSCGASAPTAVPEEPAEPAAPLPEVSALPPLQVWIATNKSTTEIQSLVEQGSQNIGLDVDFHFSNPELVLPALQGSDPPDMILLSTNSPVAFYAGSGLLLDLSSNLDQETFFPALIDTCSFNGKLFCMPWGADFQVLLWNKQLFSAVGLDPETPPASLELLTDIAGRLTRFGPEGQLEQLGFLPVLSINQASLFARMFGGYWVDDTARQITANSPQVIEALNWEQQFYFKYNYENLSTLFPYAVSLESGEHPFYSEKLAMVVADWNQARPDFIATHNVDLEFGVSPIPGAGTVTSERTPLLLDGAVVILPARATHSEGAIKLMQALGDAEILARAARLLGQFPAGPAVLDTDEFQTDSQANLFAGLLNTSSGLTAETTPLSPELESALLQVGELVLYQGADPSPLLDQVQSAFAPRLQELIGP